jgi:hypothetical protein
MRIVQSYSFKKGLEVLKKKKSQELSEVTTAIQNVNAANCKTKVSKEKTMPGKMLYSPKAFNREILNNFLYKKGWSKPKIPFERPGSYIEGDGAKNDVGLEVQFGKYAFLGWDIFGKMVIFARQGYYKYGVEIVPMTSLRRKMSTGIGSFEQITNILEKRGISNLDIPVAVLGVDC